TWGWAKAAPAPPDRTAIRASRPNSRLMRRVTSGGLGGVEQATPAQQRVGLGRAAAERDIGVFGVARSAGGIDVVMQPLGEGGIEDVAGLLEGAEGVGVHHLGPHVAVVTGGIVIAGEDMAELGRPVPQRDLGGHADFR